MSRLDSNRLVKAFAELRAAGRKTLVPFVTAGYPDMETTEAVLRDFESRGLKVCELGIPFSDPIADGPTIQASYTDALAGGVTSAKVLQAVRGYRSSGGSLALAAMVSYSIVFRHGVEQYLADLAEAGIDGAIIPDLSLEEAPALEKAAAQHGVANIMLIAPNTAEERRLEIARHSSGFIYFMSVAGITGQRDRLPEDAIRAVAELRKHTDAPVCVGFGISNPRQVAEVCKAADGAIVGSAIVHQMGAAKDDPLQERVAKIGRFVSDLLQPIL